MNASAAPVWEETEPPPSEKKTGETKRDANMSSASSALPRPAGLLDRVGVRTVRIVLADYFFSGIFPVVKYCSTSSSVRPFVSGRKNAAVMK